MTQVSELMMNSRIELVSDEEVRIRRNAPCEHYDPITTLVILASGRLNLVQDGHFDAEGRAALRDCLNCFDTHGTFAPLADTDSRPYVGKRMRRKMFLGSPETENEPCEVIAHVNGEWWSLPGVCAHGAMRAEHFLPLTPAPPKRVRAYTQSEVATHINRALVDDGERVCLELVGDGVVVVRSYRYPAVTRRIFLDKLVSRNWADTNEPCGIIEETT